MCYRYNFSITISEERSQVWTYPSKQNQTNISAMTLFIDLSDEELEKILLGDRGKDLLMEKVFNQILQAEMTEYLGADLQEEQRPEWPSERLLRASADHSRGEAHP